MDSLAGNWYIIYTKTNCEQAAKNSLDCEAVVPMIQEVVTKRGKTRTELKPRFRNYVCVKHDGSEKFFERVSLNEYVVRFVSEEPVPAPDMEEIIERQTPKNMLRTGELVEVVDGAFAKMRGIIMDQDDGEFAVEFNILDHKVVERIPKEFLVSHGV